MVFDVTTLFPLPLVLNPILPNDYEIELLITGSIICREIVFLRLLLDSIKLEQKKRYIIVFIIHEKDFI